MLTGDNQSINLADKDASKITIVCLELTMLNLTDCGLKTMPNFRTFTQLAELNLGSNPLIGASFTIANLPPITR